MIDEEKPCDEEAVMEHAASPEEEDEKACQDPEDQKSMDHDEDDQTNALKAISMTPDEMRVGNHLILFGGRDLEGYEFGKHYPTKFNPDGSVGERFSSEVDITSDYLKAGVVVDWEHGRDPDLIGNDKDAILGYVDLKTIRRTPKGIYAERVLNRRHAYMQWLEPLILARVVGSSTEPVQKSIQKQPDGTITRWGLKRDTLSVTPMDFRMLTDANAITALKALHLYPEDPSKDESVVEGVVEKHEAKSVKGNKPMNDLEAILASDLSAEVKAKLVTQLTASPAPDMSQAIKAGVEEALKAKGFGTREATSPHAQRPAYDEGDPAPKTPEAPLETAKSIHIAKYGTEDAAKAAILRDVVGTQYQQLLYDQDVAFMRYVRGGAEILSNEQKKALKTQIFPVEELMGFVYERGMSVEEMKATQVEAQGSLGGFAVPAQRQSEWIKRMRGLTAVRAAGATVITLANSNSAEVLEYTGGDERYVGALRGEWAGEGQTPNAKNMTLSTVAIPTHTYTYRVKFSQDMVEDAANFIGIFENDVVETLAIDEDAAFITGDGNKKPIGLLPGSANTFGYAEIVTGHASTLQAAGIKKLKRGIATQYRGNAIWLANSDTWGAVEVLEDGMGQWVFPDLSETDRLLNRRVFESEVMPDVAANAFPILFGNMRGYTIVERLGLSIERFHDSNTTANQTWFDVRRRIGGRPTHPWMFAIQKVSA